MMFLQQTYLSTNFIYVLHFVTSLICELDILRQRTRDVEVKRYCITLLEKFGSFEYTRDTLVQLDRDARDEVERLGGNPHMEAILDELLSWDKQK